MQNKNELYSPMLLNANTNELENQYKEFKELVETAKVLSNDKAMNSLLSNIELSMARMHFTYVDVLAKFIKEILIAHSNNN